MIIDYCAHCGDTPALRAAYNEMNQGFFEQDRVLALAREAGIGLSVVAGAREPKEGLISFATPDAAGELRLPDGVRGVRIFPTYQPWDFESDRSEDILTTAARKELIVQVCLRLQDPRVLRQHTPVGSGPQEPGRCGAAAQRGEVSYRRVAAGGGVGECGAVRLR